jgi:ribosomal protein S18 acetylase RimI-like enzyme
MNVVCLTPDEAARRITELTVLLQDAVDGGASVGFLAPLDAAEAHAYWQGVVADVAAGRRLLFAALDGAAVVGSVQLYLEGRPNGRHRGEVNKLLVLGHARRRGIATALMQALHAAAAANGRSLLVLDTVKGDHAERLYDRLGYTAAGVIPRYARSSAGGLDPTVYMYKELDADGG